MRVPQLVRDHGHMLRQIFWHGLAHQTSKRILVSFHTQVDLDTLLPEEEAGKSISHLAALLSGPKFQDPDDTDNGDVGDGGLKGAGANCEGVRRAGPTAHGSSQQEALAQGMECWGRGGGDEVEAGWLEGWGGRGSNNNNSQQQAQKQAPSGMPGPQGTAATGAEQQQGGGRKGSGGQDTALLDTLDTWMEVGSLAPSPRLAPVAPGGLLQTEWECRGQGQAGAIGEAVAAAAFPASAPPTLASAAAQSESPSEPDPLQSYTEVACR